MIQNVITTMQNAWNEQNLEQFMSGYWKSDDVTFFSGQHERQGWQDALNHYENKYKREGHRMPTLAFENIRVEMLGAETAFVRGEFHLILDDEKKPHGLFTLIFRKFPNIGWRIIHDHSSAGE